MAVVWGAVGAALGLGASGLLRGRPAAVRTLRHLARWVAAVLASLFAFAFAAGAIGAIARGDNNPKLVAMVLGAVAAAWLLWRGPLRHMAVGGYWLAGGWLVYSALIAGHGPVAGLLAVIAAPALFTAGVAAGRR